MIQPSSKKSYEQAVAKLNSLQTNAAVLERAKQDKDRTAALNVPQTEKYLQRLGILHFDLDKLNIIHVSGTKGKGSTCAFTEAILRCHNLKTGFYSSPHLISVRERIRINGQPLSKNKFADYFWEVFEKLDNSKEHPTDLPAYFKFLTVMAFYVFLKEEVNVAVIEVGIGGQFDCTNVIRQPVVCGITSLGLDHTSILGDTVEKIAWHKAGIMKPGAPAFTVVQPESAVDILQDRAFERETEVHFVPPLEAYRWFPYPPHLGLYGEVQKLNASLALQLTRYWLKWHSSGSAIAGCEPFRLPWKSALGLRAAKWPGRCQTVRKGNLFYLLDGAHTVESLTECSIWFSKTSKILTESADALREKILKVLVFNATGDRSPKLLLSCLVEHDWDYVILTTNVLVPDQSCSSDITNFQVSRESQLRRLEQNKVAWMELQNTEPAKSSTLVFEYISDVLSWISEKERNGHFEQIQVLVTGSLHLVGGLLSGIQPDITEEDESGSFKILKSHYKHLWDLRENSSPGTP
ncbi:folylpolyglutamate synthase, mitochondrial-like isoform X1 [Artemia franciscana]